MTKLVAVNAIGRRIGASHPHAKMTDAEVDMLLELRAEYGWGLRRLAKWAGLSRTAVKRILTGVSRSQHPARWKRV